MADGTTSVLDITKCDRKLWLLKVPTHVAKRWNEACNQAMNAQVGDSDDDDDDGAAAAGGSSGSRRTSSSGTAAPKRQLNLGQVVMGPNKELAIEVPNEGGKPTRYRLNQQPDPPKTYVMSLAADEVDQDAPKPKVEGLVHLQYSLVPDSLVTGQDGRFAVAASYMELHKRRVEDARRQTRETSHIKDERESRLRLTRDVPINKQIRPGASQQARRPKLDKDELERELFALFEKKANWTIPDLQKETGQGVTWLKEVLTGVADFQKKGAHVGTFELRPEYKSKR